MQDTNTKVELVYCVLQLLLMLGAAILFFINCVHVFVCVYVYICVQVCVYVCVYIVWVVPKIDTDPNTDTIIALNLTSRLSS